MPCVLVPGQYRPRPSQHELIARAIRQAELRVLASLTLRLPVDQPLGAEQIPRLPNMPVPPNAPSWVDRSILDDIGESMGVGTADLVLWKGKLLSDLYREGVCGGALVRSSTGELPQEMAVPLAHQFPCWLV